MVSSLQAKVSRLEESAGGGGGDCPDCGGPGDFGPDDSYELLWVDPSEAGPDDGEEFCETCGRQLVIVITWGDETS